METARPLDALNEARNRRVIVELKNGRQYLGKLKSFDVHVNLVLEGAEERINNEVTRKLGMIFLRGDTIIMVSPSEEVKQ
ncbi:MAG: LSM domain-containing protein [Candidatus Woesearchaeota archaeon]